MPLQNRVLPTGEIVARSERGLFTGNRGILHDEAGRLGRARWRHKHWLCCALAHPSGQYHGPMPPRRWTALFFLDEAVALAAGHRPCHECRRGAALAFRAAWEAAHGPVRRLAEIDSRLHADRIAPGRAQRHHEAPAETLPDGAFFLLGGAPALALVGGAVGFSPSGYTGALRRPAGPVTVLTPRATVETLRAGYRPVLHPTAGVTGA